MDLILKTSQNHQAPISPAFTHHHNSSTSFPILAIAIIGILATALLLISYYLFVIRCCLNIERFNILSRFSRTRSTRAQPGSYSPGIQTRGLDNSTIQAIPVIRYKKGEKRELSRERSCKECAVCLNEFLEEEKLRAIPNCAHLFHVDCIDVWLQRNENCPLCRNSVSISISQMGYPQVLSRSSPLQNPCANESNLRGNDEDYVVIELGNPTSSNPSSRRKRRNMLNHVSSMGDECIENRVNDDQFAIQPIRRSFSMDSATDRQLYLSVQEIIQKKKKTGNEDGLVCEGSSSRARRGLFSFGIGLSRSSVIPIESEE